MRHTKGKQVYLVPDDARIIRWSEIQSMYERFHSMRRVADELNIAKSQVSVVLHSLGVRVNEPGGQFGHPPPSKPSQNSITKPVRNSTTHSRIGVKVFADE